MKVRWSMVGMTDGRGSTGGQTATKTLGGAAVRKRSIPTNRRTVKQMAARNRLGTNTQAWGGLTEPERQTWIAGAPNFPQVKNGETIPLRGNTLYTKFNNNLLYAGQSVISECPLPEEMPVLILESITVAAGTPAFTIHVSEMTAPMGFTVMVRATQPYPPGRYNVTNKFTTVGPATIATGSDAMITEYTANVGTLIEGYKVTAEISLVNNTTGQKGVPSIVTAVVAA